MDSKKTAPTAVDILSFDAVSEAEHGFDFELKGPDGMTGSGVTLTVIGKHADVVQAWNRKYLNGLIREQEMAKKRGKDVEPKSIEELRAQNIEGACLRVIGWKNVTQEFSTELLKAALLRNPHWLDQIVEASDDAGNFTKAS
jgi:hypothetical protein